MELNIKSGSFHKILQNCNISKKILKYQATQFIKIMLIVYLINYHIKFIYFKNIEKLMFKCKYYKIVIFYEIALLDYLFHAFYGYYYENYMIKISLYALYYILKKFF